MHIFHKVCMLIFNISRRNKCCKYYKCCNTFSFHAYNLYNIYINISLLLMVSLFFTNYSVYRA